LRHHRVLCCDHRPRAERHQAYRRLFDLLPARLHVRGDGGRAYSVGIFHLFTHAFFKALLFLVQLGDLCEHHEQDIRNMGGLWRKIPYTFAVMCIGTLALTGFPMFAGYFSKDAIIESAYASHNTFAIYGS